MKTLITLFTAVLLSQVLSAQTTLIPDANFEQALIDRGYDTGTPDGSVPTANISSIDSLDVSWKNISDLTGIEDFTALTILNCSGNQLISLDVSSNTALANLNCTYTQLTSLDVSNNTALTSLYCYINGLASLDVSQNTSLVELFCSENQLTSLDVSNNTALTYLDCEWNQLTCLNVKNGNNQNMTGFNAFNNPNLACIEVDDAAWSTANWTSIDPIASYSTNCNNPCSSSTTGIAEYGHSFNLYPNPTTSIVTADGIKGTFELFNILGKLMQTSKTNTIDLTQLARGIYLLKATDEQGRVYSQKIIKE